MGLGARIAGIPLEQFMELLGTLGIAVIDYDSAELDMELRALD